MRLGPAHESGNHRVLLPHVSHRRIPKAPEAAGIPETAGSGRVLGSIATRRRGRCRTSRRADRSGCPLRSSSLNGSALRSWSRTRHACRKGSLGLRGRIHRRRIRRGRRRRYRHRRHGRGRCRMDSRRRRHCGRRWHRRCYRHRRRWHHGRRCCRYRGRRCRERARATTSFQCVDPRRQRLQRQLGPHVRHAGERDLEREPRIGRASQLHHQVAQHQQHARHPVGRAKLRSLPLQCGQQLFRHRRQRARTSGDRANVHVSHIGRQVARHLRGVDSSAAQLVDPGEAPRHVAARDAIHDAREPLGIHVAEHVLRGLEADVPVAEHRHLLERRDGIAHSALGLLGNEVDAIVVEREALAFADVLEAHANLVGGKTVEVEALAARHDGLRNLVRLGGAHHEHDVLGRLLQRLEQRVECAGRQHVNLVDDVYLVAPARGRKGHPAYDLFAHVVHAGARRGIDLVHVGVGAVGDVDAVLAHAARVGGRGLLAQQRLGQQSRRGGLARAPGAAEQIRVRHSVARKRVAQRLLDVLLPHHVGKRLRPVFAVERFASHRPCAPFPATMPPDTRPILLL